jgi:hypothetical protein
MHMKNFKKLKAAFGIDEMGNINFPYKISNIQISRISNGDKMGCSHCFPHGFETINASWKKNQRCWKKFREKQWK